MQHCVRQRQCIAWAGREQGREQRRPLTLACCCCCAAPQFRLDYALSREGPKNKRGGKMYIQVRASFSFGVQGYNGPETVFEP